MEVVRAEVRIKSQHAQTSFGGVHDQPGNIPPRVDADPISA